MRTLPLSLGGIAKFFLIKADILHFLLRAIARYGFENENYSQIYASSGAPEIARTSLSYSQSYAFRGAPEIARTSLSYSQIYASSGAPEIARTSLSCISIFYENLNL